MATGNESPWRAKEPFAFWRARNGDDDDDDGDDNVATSGVADCHLSMRFAVAAIAFNCVNGYLGTFGCNSHAMARHAHAQLTAHIYADFTCLDCSCRTPFAYAWIKAHCVYATLTQNSFYVRRPLVLWVSCFCFFFVSFSLSLSLSLWLTIITNR